MQEYQAEFEYQLGADYAISRFMGYIPVLYQRTYKCFHIISAKIVFIWALNLKWLILKGYVQTKRITTETPNPNKKHASFPDKITLFSRIHHDDTSQVHSSPGHHLEIPDRHDIHINRQDPRSMNHTAQPRISCTGAGWTVPFVPYFSHLKDH